MSNRHLTSHLVLGAAVAVIACGARAATVHVPADYPYIDMALEFCLPGDEIIVAEGTYIEQIDFRGKAITLRSTDPDDPAVVAATIIDGSWPSNTVPVVTCTSGEGPDTVLSGFTIQEGSAVYGAGLWTDGSPTVINCVFTHNSASTGGGGISMGPNSSLTITGCTFSENTAPHGGGIYIYDSSPTLEDCTFESNIASLRGGGVNMGYGSAPSLTGCTFTGNWADDDGGGMYIHNNSTPTITGCTFTGNSAVDGGGGVLSMDSAPTIADSTFDANVSGAWGGGLYVALGTPTVTNCDFEHNEGSHGGGIFNSGSDLTVTGCSFLGNSAQYLGGGMENYTGGSAVVTDCVFTENTAGDHGGGMLNNLCSPMVANCTFTNNTANMTGGGIRSFVDTSATVTDSAFCGNSPTHIQGDVVLVGQIDMSAFCPIAACPGDISGDGEVNVVDFLAMLANWGVCP